MDQIPETDREPEWCNLYPLGSGVGGEQWQMQGEAGSYWSPDLGLKKVERNWCLFQNVTFGLS